MIPLRDSLASIGNTGMTRQIIVMNMLVFITALISVQVSPDAHTVAPAAVTVMFSSGNTTSILHTLHNVLVSMFIHGGWSHLLLNMLFLLVFGPGVERRVGSSNFLLLYVLTGYAGTAAHVLSSAHSTVPLMGAAGAIGGVLGAYCVFHPRAQLSGIVFMPGPLYATGMSARIFLGYLVATQLVVLSQPDRAIDSTAAAHLSGFVAGMVMAWLINLGHWLGIDDECYSDRWACSDMNRVASDDWKKC